MRWLMGLLCAGLLAGCEEEPIRRYTAPRLPRPMLVTTAPTPPADVAPPTGDAPLGWTLPDGWRMKQEPGPMRVATFLAGDGSVEIAVTTFPGDVGGTLANVNRWRQQVNLPPVASIEEQPMRAFNLAGRQAYLVSLPGLTALGVRDAERTWFVKMTGLPDAVTAQSEAFVAFMRSMHWSEP